MVYTCKYCKKTLSTKSNLNYHVKSAKYCLKIQGKIEEEPCYSCDCGREFKWRTSLTRHQKTCIDRESTSANSTVIAQQEKMLQALLDTLKDIAKTPTTTTTTIKNTNNLNLQPITFQYLEAEGNKHLTEQIVMEGRQPEIAGKVFDGYVVVADKSRKKIKYTDEDGNLSTNSKKLIQEFYKAIQSKNKELADNLYGEIHESVNELISQGKVCDSDFTRLLTSGTDLQDRLIAIKNLTDGVVDDNSTKLLDETIKCIISDI